MITINDQGFSLFCDLISSLRKESTDKIPVKNSFRLLYENYTVKHLYHTDQSFPSSQRQVTLITYVPFYFGILQPWYQTLDTMVVNYQVQILSHFIHL